MLACSRGGGRGLQSKHVCSTPASCGAVQPREERRQYGLQAPNMGPGWTQMTSTALSHKLMLTCACFSAWSVVPESQLLSHLVFHVGRRMPAFAFTPRALPTSIPGGYLLGVFPLHRHNLSRNSQEMVYLIMSVISEWSHTHAQKKSQMYNFIFSFLVFQDKVSLAILEFTL